mmetsp:Transcript_124660/g.248829  ORF Transcript_124660/g.248829 Transcript_124660/m.248829 type:complete len:360 (+) Transcript_124660:95-1174(+)
MISTCAHAWCVTGFGCLLPQLTILSSATFQCDITGGRPRSAQLLVPRGLPRPHGRHHQPRIPCPAEDSQRSRGRSRKIPFVSEVPKLWDRNLHVSAVLIVLIAALWCLQGLLGLRRLDYFNSMLSRSQQLPASSALESWLFGNHPHVTVWGRRVAATMSSLELDFEMDKRLVTNCGQVHRLLTACFLHNGIFHLLFNLGYLHSMSPFEAGSSGAYLCTFILAGIGGNWAFMRFSDGCRALGASGGVSGLIGFELVSRLRGRQVRASLSVARSALGLLVVGALLPGVANWAHAGGLVIGIVVAMLTTRRSGYRAPLVPWPVLLGLLLFKRDARRFMTTLGKALVIGIQQPYALGDGLVIT